MAEIFLHDIGIVSNEFESAKKLKALFEESLSNVQGKIWIVPSVDIRPGTGYHDLDLLLIGYLDGFYQDVINYQDVEIKSFCTVVEIKSHNADGVRRDGMNLIVEYPDGSHNVTIQSNKQKETLRKFLQETLRSGRLPFVTNVIWLTGVDYDDFEESVGLINSNIVTSDMTMEDLFVAVGRQCSLRDQGYVDAFRYSSREEIESFAKIFCAKSDGVDTMSLRRFNILQQNNDMYASIENNRDQVIVVAGHAGTGKTMILLQAADYLSRRRHKCLFLTYNTALIADLKHTINYLPIVSDIKMESMHSFIISVLYRNGLWKSNYTIENDFPISVADLLRMKNNIKFIHDYEYVFVDEAQDWEAPIPEILKYLFKNSHIVIADGIDQFMKSSEHTDWNGSLVMPKLKKCLRQRHNLTVFAKLFASKMGVYWDVNPNNDFPGGRVLVYNAYEAEIHNKLLSEVKEHGCVEYDMMLLAPKSLATSGKFDLLEAYNRNNIYLYDGIDKQVRNQIYGPENAKNKESRIYTYESCRGLEAWTTVCLRFDELFSCEHSHDYHKIEYSMARNYMLTLWSLIPLTRAIDTLVLVVKENSKISKILKELSEENPDIITYNDHE